MSKLPVISANKAVKAFVKMGYHITRQRGSHIRLHHPKKKPLTIPNHRVLGKGLLRRLIRDAEISVDELIKILKN